MKAPRRAAGQADSAQADPENQETPCTRPCGAKTRRGGRCRRMPAPGAKRCRMHGGVSTGPKCGHGGYSKLPVVLRHFDPDELEAAKAAELLDLCGLGRQVTLAQMDRLAARRKRGEVDQDTYDRGMSLFVDQGRRIHATEAAARAALARAVLDTAQEEAVRQGGQDILDAIAQVKAARQAGDLPPVESPAS